MNDRPDLSSCAREPIRIPGSIQPHGALIGLQEPHLEVVLASANASGMLGGNGDLQGARLGQLVDAASMKTLTQALHGDPRDANPLVLRLSDGRPVHGLAHRSDGLLLLEFEPAETDEDQFRTAYRRLVRRFEWLRRSQSLREISEIAVREMQRLTGFDRVMVYRFDSHANGEVIAEQCVDAEMESFLGLHYPASDIPAQARRLYVENPIRLIVDVNYTPVPINPDVNPLTRQPLNLSHAALRSVSPIHCEYLRNMGVGASMSISLLSGEELWGLIACHHREPFHVPYSTRLVCEFLAHVLSARIVELDRIEVLTHKTRAYGVQSRLIDEMVSAPRFQEGLGVEGRQLTDLIRCNSAAVLFRGEVTRIGPAPEERAIRELGAALARRERHEVVATDCLASIHPPAADYVDIAAGAVAVPISADGSDLIFWFRDERIRSVTWAGNPDKAVIAADDGSARLRPRASFAAWVEQVRGQSEPWADWEIEVAADFRTALVASIIHQAAELERLNTRLLKVNRTKDEFLAMVSHELRNPLNAILGWVRIARMGMSDDDLQRALETIERNAVAQSTLVDDLLDIGRIESGRLQLETRPLDLRRLVTTALETVEPSARAREITICTEMVDQGTEVVGDSRRLQQVVWNLLTNAIKFSDEGTRIDVTLERRASTVALAVSDEGIGIHASLLPSVFEPFRQGEGPAKRSGLGLGLSIVKSIVELHGGHIGAVSGGQGKGSTFTVTLPIAALRTGDDVGVLSRTGAEIDLSGLDLLVVDDNQDAAEMVATLLRNHGASVRVAGNGLEGLRSLEQEPCALIISDLDMPEMDGFALMAAVRERPALRALPAIALTAYARGGDRARALAAGFRQYVAKPVDPDELVTVVASVLGRL